MSEDPHGGQGTAAAGPRPEAARLTVVAAHGRGGSAEDMLGLAAHVGIPDIAWLAPRAAGRSWWPESFLAPLADNEPGLSSALRTIEAVTSDLVESGVSADRVVVLGFSQGACLALEHAARTGRGYRAVAALSGGLVGTGEAGGSARDDLHGRTDKTFDYAGSLDTDVLIGCHERDPHIPLARVRRSADVLKGMGARVTVQVHPGAGHGIVASEIAWLRGVLNASGRAAD